MMIVEIPGVGNVEFPDDMSPEAVADAVGAMTKATQVKPNPDGTYGTPPPGMVLNPATGQMEDLTDPKNPNVPTGKLAAGVLGLGQGLAFNGFDETVAGLGAIAGGDYEYELAVAREAEARARKDHPWIYNPLSIGGAIASSLGIGKALGVTPATTVKGRAAQGAGFGLMEGALSGLGAGEGVNDRFRTAAAQGGLGLAIGAAVPVGLEGVRKALAPAVGGARALTGNANAPAASRAVRSAMERAGMTADDAEAAIQLATREGQPGYVLADALGYSGQRALAGASRVPTNARQEVADFLMTRQAGQAGRVGQFAREALDVADTAQKYTDDLVAARGAAADTAYEAARQNAGAVNLNGAIDVIDTALGRDPILGETALSKGPIGTRLTALRARMASGGEQLIDFDTVLNIKSDIFGQIQNLRKAGKTVPKELSDVYGALDAALENASSGYRAANDGYRTASAVIGSVDQGAAAARPSVRAEDTIPRYQGLTPDQQAAFRTGYADPLLARVEASPPGVNAARAFTTPKLQSELGAMATDPALFSRRIGRENTMFATQNAVLGGSKTADNLADMADAASFDYGPLASVMQGRFGEAAAKLGMKVVDAGRGVNTATREEIARMLLSKDPKKALAAGILADTLYARRAFAGEALGRNIVRGLLPTGQ